MAAGRDGVDVVAADPAQQLRPAGVDLIGLARRDGAKAGDQVPIRPSAVHGFDGAGDLAEMPRLAVRHHGVDGAHVLDHVAVPDGPRPAAVVAGHAADGGAAGGRRVDGKEQPMGLEKPVQLVENHARLHAHGARPGIEVKHGVQVLRRVDDQGLGHGLPALGRPAAARQHRRSFLGRDLDDAHDVFGGARHDHADGLDLVDRGVVAVAAAGERVEQHLSLQGAAQPLGEGAVADARRGLVGDGSVHGPGEIA